MANNLVGRRDPRARGPRATLAFLLAFLALGALAAAARPAAAQSSTTAGWTVRRDAFAELWYHGLALVAPGDYGPLPMYSAAYVRTATAARRRAATPSRLDAAVAPLRVAFQRDSAFEVLHFVPLYFVGEAPDAVLGALRAAIRDGAAPAKGSLGARAAAVAAALPAAEQRQALSLFLDALEDEWRGFVGADRATRAPDDVALASLQRDWDAVLAPALAPYLEGVRRTRGVIVVVPALGAEGRILSAASGEAIVAVGAEGAGEASGGVGTPLLAAVRELAFPLLDRVPGAGAADRLAAERAREIAAVRAGAALLDRFAPPLSGPYRRHFADVASGPAREAFARRFPIDGATDAALVEECARYASRARAPR